MVSNCGCPINSFHGFVRYEVHIHLSRNHTHRIQASGIAGVAMFWDLEKAKEIRALGVGFHSCSVALNLITTILIAGRLMYQRKQVRELGDEHSNRYLSLMAVFAESGAIYSIAGLVFIPLYARNSIFVFPFAGLVEAASVSVLIQTFSTLFANSISRE